MNIAQITVSGNIGSDPEIRTVGETKVATFSVAVNEGYKNKNGEKVEKTHWYNIEAWDGNNGRGLVTNVIEPYVKKGSTVYAQGFPIIEEYTDKDNVTKRAFKVKLAGAGSTFRLSGSGKTNDTPATDSKPSTSYADASKGSGMDDDIPF